MKDKLLVIAGPTASGKTALSIRLAKLWDGEIVNFDSMQVYRHMNIGTAKPTIEEREGVPHHLLDVAEPTDRFSVGDFLPLAEAAVQDILKRGKLPIMVGGTGLYIDTFLQNRQLGEDNADLSLRAQLRAQAEAEGAESLHRMLAEVDPASAERIHPNNLNRVIRALEVYRTTGKTMTVLQEESRREPPRYEARVLGISMERELLYDRINRRVELMLEAGLLQEVKALVKGGVTADCTAMQGIGYKELLPVLAGEQTIEDAADSIRQRTRNYAKRQMTWFRKNPQMEWIPYDKIHRFGEE